MLVDSQQMYVYTRASTCSLRLVRWMAALNFFFFRRYRCLTRNNLDKRSLLGTLYKPIVYYGALCKGYHGDLPSMNPPHATAHLNRESGPQKMMLQGSDQEAEIGRGSTANQ
jgi:hypothetical protein